MLWICLCESSYFVNMHLLFFCQKYMFLSILLHSVLLFSVLFNEIFIKIIHLLSMYRNLWKFAQRTLFLKVVLKHVITVVFLRFLFSLLSCSSDVPSLYFSRLSNFWSMLHQGSVGRVQNKIKNIIRHFFGSFFFLFFIMNFFLSWCTL